MFHKLLILRSPGIGPVKYSELIRRFGSAAAAADFIQTPALADSVRREMDLAASMDIRYIPDDSPLYPENLRAVKNHPPVISARGNLAALSKPAVAIVGTRHATAAAARFVHEMAMEFAKTGRAVVSGMAMGTDAAAHMGALAVPGDSQTVAVMAGGADYVWPPENEKLYRRITERGAAISEMPVGTVPVANNFVHRNRWIAGISDMLILGEADLKSGSMATAAFMREYGRRVFAIPGHPSDPRSAGPNRLIKEGCAVLCSGIGDFLDDGAAGAAKKEKALSENSIADLLGNIPTSESVLAKLAEKNIDEIKRDLIVLELNGFIRKTNDGYVKI